MVDVNKLWMSWGQIPAPVHGSQILQPNFFTGVVQKKEFKTTLLKNLRVKPVVGVTLLKSMD